MRFLALVPVMVCLLLASAAPSGAEQPRLSRGQWVPTWTMVYGGYRQVEAMAAANGAAWGVDYTVVSGPTGNIGQTAFVEDRDGIWVAAQIVNGVSLQAIAMAGPALGFAVGVEGAIYRFDGRLWSPMPSPTRQELAGVALAAPDEGWAVGERATILRWDGSDWRLQESPVSGSRITAVTTVGSGRAWATTLGGHVLEFDGEEWTVAEAPLLQRAVAVAFASPDYGLAVGQSILLYDGAWREIQGPARGHVSVAFWQDTAYVVGDARVYRLRRGGQWEPVETDGAGVPMAGKSFSRVGAAPRGVWAFASDGTTMLLRDDAVEHVRPRLQAAWAIDMVSSSFGWAGGRAATAAFLGTDAGPNDWRRTQAAPHDTYVRAIDLVSTQDGWAVGSDPTGFPDAHLWRWDGEQWRDWPIDKTWEIGDIHMLGADEGWASKGNVIARWDGEAWQQVLGAPPYASAGGLAMLRGGDEPEGWFGAYGGLVHLKGDVWTPITLTHQALVTDIEVPDATEGWAITDKVLYRYDGASWTEVDLPFGAQSVLYDVDAPDRGNAWVLADPDGLYHWNGTDWQHHDLAPFGDAFEPVRLRALRLDPESLATDVWLVGLPPSIGRYSVVTPVGTAYLPTAGRRAVR